MLGRYNAQGLGKNIETLTKELVVTQGMVNFLFCGMNLNLLSRTDLCSNAWEYVALVQMVFVSRRNPAMNRQIFVVGKMKLQHNQQHSQQNNHNHHLL